MIKTAIARLAKGSLIYGVGGVLQRFISLLLLPFFTQVLTPEDYGVVALISLVGVAMSGLLNLGTGNSMGLLYYREEDRSKRPTIIWTNLLLLTVNGLFWYGVLFVLAPTLSGLMFQSNQYANLIRLSFLGTVISTVTDPWLAYLRMEEKARIYVALTFSTSLLSILLSVHLVLFLRMGLVGMVLAGILSQTLMLLVVTLTVGRNLPFGLNTRLFSPLVRIGFPSIFGLFAFLLIDYADRQMIARMVGLSALGIYSLGYSFGMVIMIAINAFATAWPPFFMSYMNKHDEARQVFARVLTYYMISLGGLSVLFFFVARPVTLLMTAPAFHEAWAVVGLVAASYALKGCYLIVLPGIYFASKLHHQSVIEWLAALINVGLNLLLIPLYGITGAALATFASYLSLPVLAWFISRHYLAVDYEWRRVGLTCAVVGVACVLLFTISVQHAGLQPTVIFMNMTVLMVFLGITYKFLLTGSERDLLKAKLRV